MKLQPKLLLSFGTVLLVSFSLVEIIGYRQTQDQTLVELRKNALEIRGILMATRRAYHKQFIQSNLPLNKNTLGFLPAYVMNRISKDFLNWSNSGLTFNNVSDHSRNPDNQADKIELEAMAFFRSNPKENERLVRFENGKGQSFYHFSSPIWIEQYCLKCHGKRDESPQTIREMYSASFNYKLGELRGLMSIKLPVYLIEEEIKGRQITELIRHLFAFFVTIVFGAWLLNRLVIRRMVMLQKVTGELADGNYDVRVPIKGNDEISDLAIAFNNMAEQRQKAESLRCESEQQVRDILDSTAEAIYSLDKEGRATLINPACLDMLGYQDLSELMGKELHPIIHHTKTDGSSRTLNECLIARTWRFGEAHHTIEDIFWRKDGTSFPVEFSSYPILRNGIVVGAVATFFDITERLINEEGLRRAQKMKAVGQLTGGIAHDFNNLLGIILGNLDFIQRLVSDNDKVSKRIDTTQKAALRAADLTKQLLGFSRRESENISTTDLNQVIRAMESFIARSITPEIEVEFQLSDKLWATEIDSGDLQDALLNLILNARDAMPEGGKLVIETSNSVLDPICEGHNIVIKQGNYIQLAVSDNGSGISAKILEHIFEPFFTTKAEGKGTGLGMSMVYGFVQRSNGYIKAYSEPNIGTTIRIYLPRSCHEVQNYDFVMNKKTSLAKGSETILIVDDEKDLLELAQENLISLGYQTIIALNAEQALQILNENAEIDLLFSDVVMPGGINGYELAELALSKIVLLKVLLTSGFTKKTIAKNGPARFCENLLSKPYSKAELAQRIRDVLDE